MDTSLEVEEEEVDPSLEVEEVLVIEVLHYHLSLLFSHMCTLK